VVFRIGEEYPVVRYADRARIVNRAELLGRAVGGGDAHEGGFLAGRRSYVIQ